MHGEGRQEVRGSVWQGKWKGKAQAGSVFVWLQAMLDRREEQHLPP